MGTEVCSDLLDRNDEISVSFTFMAQVNFSRPCESYSPCIVN